MSPPPYELVVDGFARDLFRVHSLTGTEVLSEAYDFEITATAELGQDIERRALGRRASLVFHTGPEPRAIYGVIAAVRLASVHQIEQKVKYHLRLVPRLWLLKRKRRTRIFQKMRVTDIVTAVLAEAGITTRWQLTHAYPEREYCTQYEETDYRFVQRLLAEAGIYFSFFTGGPVDDATLLADAAMDAAVGVGSAIAGELGGGAVAGLVGSAAKMAETLIPGDTIVCADDASCYPPVGGDDPAALAASTAAALAPAVGEALGVGGVAGAALGVASSIAGSVIADLATHEVPTLRYLESEEARVTRFDKITRFTLKNTLRSSAATFRDYDPMRPMVRLQSTAVSSAPFPPSPLEAAAMAAAAAENAASAVSGMLPGPAAGVISTVGSAVDKVGSVVNQVAGALGQKVPSEVYDHHAPFLFPKWGFAQDEAPKMLRQKRRRASVARGESGCSDFSPGHRFSLEHHPAPELDGAYVLTRVEHRGETHPEQGREGEWQIYACSFECVPAEMTYPPQRQKRKSVQVSLTATVVGPPGEEIHVDAMGQIRVQFHWDREGKYDDKSSCWIRVMQPWAGAGWGHQFIPRIGQEVVVVFEGGDPDKPMVLGALYNGTHPPPFALPGDKTRSGIRTQTSPGGGGFNELSFEDRRGGEQVYIHAQRDLNEIVRNNHSTVVAASQTVRVGADREQHVGGDSRVRTAKSLDEKIGADRHLTVGGADYEVVKGSRMTAIEERFGLQVGDGLAVVIGDKDNARSGDVFAWGDYSLGAKSKLRLTSQEGIVLRCGDSSIEITKKGIVLKGGNISIAAAKSVKVAGKGPSLALGEEAEIMAKVVRLVSSKASLVLDEEAHLDGKQVKLNCQGIDPEATTDDDEPLETQHLSIKLTDPEFEPYADKEYMLTAGGVSFEGKTNGEGKVEIDIPKDAEVAQIIVFVGDRPDGRKERYQISLGELPDPSTMRGAQLRLKNMGYFWGEPGTRLDTQTRRALQEFQRDHGIEETGRLDAATVAKLSESHGH